MTKPFYITTAIDYPNGTPHMGHAYEKVCTDFYARHARLFSGEAYFLTGTDENGQKLIKSAQAASQPIQQFVDTNVEIFRKLCDSLEISHDDFIRTTEERHSKFVQSAWTKLSEKGMVYEGTYSGNYCYDCENFYSPAQAKDDICPEHHKPLVQVEEKGYFFKLSEFHDKVLGLIEGNPSFIVPEKARNEILSRLKSDRLKDIAISRPNEGWGITVPGDDKFVVYTWFDALMNYVSGLSDDQKKTIWPADVHVVGKDITWFHTVIWPAILMGLEIETPKQVYVHGMVLDAQGRKMSKSLNNGIDPMVLIEKYPIETFRYYLLYGIPAHNDGSFSEEELVSTHNTALANDFGNLVSRVVKLALKKFDNPEVSGDGVACELDFKATSEGYQKFVTSRDHNKALGQIREYVQSANQYVNDKAPWKCKEADQMETLRGIIYNCLYAIHCTSYYYSPAMPEVHKRVMAVLSPSDMTTDPVSLFGKVKYTMAMPDILFKKIEI